MPQVSRRAWLFGTALAGLPLALAGCSRFALLNALAPDDGVSREPDLAYGPDPRHRLDLYRPSGRDGESLSTVLFLYGGSWKRGSRVGYRFAGAALARRGFEVAVADYRLYPQATFPAFVEDAARATAWLAERRGRPVHLVGHSAGAHSAALLALDPRYLDAAGIGRAALGRFVGLAGPYAFHPLQVRSVRAVFASVDDEDRARPITFAGPGAPSTLLLHGADDGIVDPRNSGALATALQQAGVAAEARLYDGIGHAEIVLALTSPFTNLAPTLDDTARFLTDGAFPV